MGGNGKTTPMDEQLKDQLFAILEKDFNIAPASLDPDQPISQQVSLDSMQFVSIIGKIELVLNIELPMSVMEAKTLNEFLSFVEETIKKVNS
jgi:acyl carrier protein